MIKKCLKRGAPKDEPGEARRSQEAPKDQEEPGGARNLDFPEERQKRSLEAPGSSLGALITLMGPNDTALS